MRKMMQLNGSETIFKSSVSQIIEMYKKQSAAFESFMGRTQRRSDENFFRRTDQYANTHLPQALYLRGLRTCWEVMVNSLKNFIKKESVRNFK